MNFGTILIYIVTYVGLFMAIFFFITLFEHRRNIKKEPSKSYPKVSVLIPAYNEEKTISKTISSLLNLNYPKNRLEIIVIDDGSTDNTYKIARKFILKGVKVYTKKNEGKGKTLNFGLTKVTSSLIGCLDADSFVSRDSLKKIVSYFDDPNVMCVTPALKIYKPKNLLQKIQRIEYLMGIFLRKIFAFLGSIHVTPGPFSIYRKKFFDKYGGYDEDNPTEDIEVALRIQSKGYVIENSVDANVYTIGPNTFKELLKQRLRWYVGFIENVSNYRHLFSKKHGNLGLFILPASFVSVILILTTLFYSLYTFLDTMIQNYINLRSINFDIFKLIDFSNINIFYIPITPIIVLTLLTLTLALIALFISKWLSNEKDRIITSYIPYLFFYWILFGFWWLMTALYKITRRRLLW